MTAVILPFKSTTITKEKATQYKIISYNSDILEHIYTGTYDQWCNKLRNLVSPHIDVEIVLRESGNIWGWPFDNVLEFLDGNLGGLCSISLIVSLEDNNSHLFDSLRSLTNTFYIRHVDCKDDLLQLTTSECYSVDIMTTGQIVSYTASFYEKCRELLSNLIGFKVKLLVHI